MTDTSLAGALIDVLQDIAVLTSFVGIFYLPFHFLDQHASTQAKSNALGKIRAGQGNADTRPLVPLLNKFFGPKHLSLRCIVTSSVMSLMFTALFLGAADRYVLDVAAHTGAYDARVEPLDRALQEAFPPIIEMADVLIEALEASLENNDNPETRAEIEDLKNRRQQLVEMQNRPITGGTLVLLWMVLSVAISMNLICDYVALAKTRWILKRISATELRVEVGAYLLLDVILAVAIWAVSMTIFLGINHESITTWLDDFGALMVTVGIVSLATTIATSMWIYTFLTGTFVSARLRRLISFMLRRTTELVDPAKHTFKVIGIVGSVVNIAVLAGVYLALRFLA